MGLLCAPRLGYRPMWHYHPLVPLLPCPPTYSLALHRRVIILVKAGAPVDQTIEGLTQYMEPGDIIIDGGNEWCVAALWCCGGTAPVLYLAALLPVLALLALLLSVLTLPPLFTFISIGAATQV